MSSTRSRETFERSLKCFKREHWPKSFTWARKHMKYMGVFWNRTSLLSTKMAIDGLVELYFNLRLYDKDITNLISRHCYVVSEQHLKRLLKSYWLFWRRSYTSYIWLNNNFHSKTITNIWTTTGYEGCTENVRLMGYNCGKADVRLILLELDPRGV